MGKYRHPDDASKEIVFPKLSLFTTKANRKLRWGLGAVFFIFCFFYGASFTLLAPNLVTPLMVLLVIPAALIVWALPEAPRAPVRTLGFLYFALFALTLLWPAYLAVKLPGWPWISPQRVVQASFVVVLLACLSVSAKFRSDVAVVFRSVPWLTRTVFVFVLLQFVSIFYSMHTLDSVNRFVVVQITWTAVFAAGCFVFMKKGNAEKMAGLLLVSAILLCGVGLWENHLGRVPWAGHIPSFLQINDPVVDAMLKGMDRFGRHRVQAIFDMSLSFSEYLALMVPFALHFLLNPYRIWIRLACLLAIPLMIYTILLTQSRIGLVGLLIVLILYPASYAFVRRRQDKTSLAAATVTFLSPFAAVAAVWGSLAIGRIRAMLLGSGVTAISTQARVDQLHQGIPKILAHPWGFGIGQGAQALGYQPYGFLTIDSYWLRVTMEFGPLGLLLFFAIFVAAFYYASRLTLVNWNAGRESRLTLPLAVAIIEFFMMRSAFAQETNIPIAYLIVSMVAGLAFRAATNRVQNNSRDLHAVS